MEPASQQAIGRDMVKLTIGLWAFVCLWTSASVAQPDNLDDVYTTRAVATGKADMTSPVKEPYPNRWWQENLPSGAKHNAARRFF